LHILILCASPGAERPRIGSVRRPVSLRRRRTEGSRAVDPVPERTRPPPKGVPTF